jgi:tRNA(His) 5'-end guanylyltransferase
MNTTFCQKLQNNIVECEEMSDKKIPLSSYYLVIINIFQDNISSNSNLSEVQKDTYIQNGKELLKQTKKDQINLPIIAYIYSNQIYILYSCLENGSHNFNGSQQQICSYFTSIFTLKYKCFVSTKIVEFDSKIKISAYFKYRMFENTKETIRKLSKGTITEKNIKNLTLDELIQILKNTYHINWSEIKDCEKYGIFYKYENKKFVSKSGIIDFNNNLGQYNEYFFD